MDKGIKWYSLENILKHKAQYYIIMGERSNGKTYATFKYIIDQFFDSDGEKLFGYIKRYDEDIKGKLMEDVFNHLEPYLLEKYNMKIKFYRGKWYLYDKESEGKLSDCILFGYAFSITTVNRTKGLSFPKIENIVFEEFISIDCTYLPDEINKLLNVISTIARDRTTVRVFMLANTISKHSPYLQALGIKLHRQKKGSIEVKTYTNEEGFKTTFAIERTEKVNVFDNKMNQDKIVFNIFGNSGVGKMITSGDFETHKYKQMIDGYCFEENIALGSKIIGKKYRTSLVLQFEDYFYRIYLIEDNIKPLIAFREIEEENISHKNTTHIIGGKEIRKNIVNVYNFMYFNSILINDLFTLIVQCFKQEDFIVISDDDGENVVNGFRLCGMNYVNK